MYIQFNDIELQKTLQNASIATVKMGSHLYGCSTPSSDTDYLCIYVEGIKNANSFVWEHHPFQFKTDYADWNYTTLQKFIRNLINGDSPHNFEVLYSEEFATSDLSWLLKYRSHFSNYNLIRSYLGLVKRDMKDFNKELHGVDRSNITTLGYKKLAHAYRGLDTAINMMVNNPYQYHTKGESVVLERHKNMKTGNVTSNEIRHYRAWIENNLESVRNQLNDMLSSHTIHKIMSPEIAKELDDELMNFCQSIVYKSKEVDYIDYRLIPYSAIENGVSY